jgi:hypothetical protein
LGLGGGSSGAASGSGRRKSAVFADFFVDPSDVKSEPEDLTDGEHDRGGVNH